MKDSQSKCTSCGGTGLRATMYGDRCRDCEPKLPTYGDGIPVFDVAGESSPPRSEAGLPASRRRAEWDDPRCETFRDPGGARCTLVAGHDGGHSFQQSDFEPSGCVACGRGQAGDIHTCEPSCENCDDRKCMGCVFREYDHECTDDCPMCCESPFQAWRETPEQMHARTVQECNALRRELKVATGLAAQRSESLQRMHDVVWRLYHECEGATALVRRFFPDVADKIEQARRP